MGGKTPDFFEINNFRNFRRADYKVCFAGTIHDLVVKYTIMESKVYDFDWKYTIICEVYMIIFWKYAIIDLKLYYQNKFRIQKK